jgi:dihydrodipicolinate synthase/N-acetylneuraminate lyase
VIAAARASDWPAARELQDRPMPLHMALLLEPSPAGIKHAEAGDS